ncbi:MAG TPA: ATPase, T2SS/T4P/T4SS family [Acidobacteriota bacterium]|nr:ATPase, T2SS/T4P/T4SS family [Acidobacteriota bacterium]
MDTSVKDDRKLLGEILVEAGLINETQLDQALRQQREHGGRLGFNLVRLGFLTPERLTAFLKDYFGLGVTSGDTPVERQKAADAIPRHLALYYRITPIKLENDVLSIGLATMDHANLIQALEEVTGYKIDPLIYPESEIRSLIDGCYRIPTERGVELFTFSDNIFSVVDQQKRIKPLTANQLKNERDVGEWLRSIVAEAIKDKSREILIKPEPDGATVSFRKDTFFLSDFSIPPDLHDNLTFLLYRLARLNPLQQQKPQHGRFLVKVLERRLLMVVSAYPTIYGIRFMLEMFDEKLLRHSYEEVVAPYPDLKLDLEDFMLRARKGMIILTGPEGAGRTSFLYSYLSKCKDEFSQIITLENMVRYPIGGLSQTEVSEEEMEGALENVLKQRPELVAVNSIRSVRAADVAFLIAARIPMIVVLSSYDSYVALDWLCRYQLKSAVKAGLVHSIISPRLLPKACPNCAVSFELPADLAVHVSLPQDARFRANQGCDFCRNTENVLSQLVFEFVRPDAQMMSWLEEDHRATVLRRKARQAGQKTLFDVAIQQAARGLLDTHAVLKLQSV